MFAFCQSILFISFFIIIHSQRNDDRDYPPERYQTSRVAKTSFDTQFSTGRCPQRFFQVGDECLFFATDGKSYSWIDAERLCRGRIGRMVDQWAESSAMGNQPNLKPTLGVRQLVLNTPEKTDILRALYQIYGEENFAVRLPNDYNTLRRCSDGHDDKWPYFCNSIVPFNTTCFEAKSNSATDLCLRDVACGNRYLRLACEFTLPGSPEITESKFRHCPKSARRRLLPIWAWILIAIGSALVLLSILATIIIFVSSSKKKKSKYTPSKAYSESRVDQDRTRRQNPPPRQDPASEPMLVRPAPPPRPVEDTGYLQPRSDDRPATTATNGSNSNA